MATTFEYSVLRLIPDQTRGERINVGIAIFLDGNVDVRVFPDMAKVRALNPNVKPNTIRLLPSALNEFVGGDGSTSERWAALRRFPLVSATELGWFESDARDYESNVQKLISRFVATPQAPRRASPTRLSSELRKKFAKSNLLGSDAGDINSHLIVPNFPIAEAEGLAADFALKNGAMHFTAAIDLRGTETTIRSDKRGQTALKSVMLSRAKERFSDCKRIAVYVAGPGSIDLIEPHLAMLHHDTDEMYNYNDRDEMAAFMERMQQAARA